jgi:hypothetical protein
MMKSVKNQVSVKYQVLNQVRNQVSDQVWNQVLNQVRFPILRQVSAQAGNVLNQIEGDIL